VEPLINAPNTTQQFEMIVDTGASGTVITSPLPRWWQWLQSKYYRYQGGRRIPIGYQFLEVGGAVVKMYR